MQAIKTPYGYKFIDNALVVDKKEAAIIEAVYNLRANGHSCNKITERINANGHKTRNKLQFHPMQIWRILTNPVYLGKNGMPRIIDNKLWETAQAVKSM
jgi:site-specific DNA recombinase